VKARLKVPRKLQQPTQIDHRVSAVLPDDGERLTFCGVDGVRRWRFGHRLAVRVSCDAAHDTETPTCFEALGDFGTDVRRVGRVACGLRVDALKPGLVGAGGATSLVFGDAAGVPLAADAAHKPPWSPQMATRPNPCVRVCASVSRVPAGMMEGQSPPAALLAVVAPSPKCDFLTLLQQCCKRNKIYLYQNLHQKYEQIGTFSQNRARG
jgi:hypothetical protein